MQQPGVEQELLECLLEYGVRQYDHKGCEIVYLTDDCLDAIARYESRHLWVRMSAARSVYPVVDADGGVVTMGHRYRRVKRDLSLSSLRPGRTRKPHPQAALSPKSSDLVQVQLNPSLGNPGISGLLSYIFYASQEKSYG